MKKVILCIGTLDTKGPEISYMRELIEKKGHGALIMDVSTLEKAAFQGDITPEEIARAGGASMEDVRALKESDAAELMISGAIQITKDLYNSARFHGVIGIGIRRSARRKFRRSGNSRSRSRELKYPEAANSDCIRDRSE